MRTIEINTPGSDELKSIRTDATTWSELCRDLNNAGISTTGMKGVVRGTQVTLEAGNAIIPDGAAMIYLFTAKVKSGGTDLSQMMQDLRDAMENAFNEIIENLDDGAYATEESEAKSSLLADRKKLEREFDSL